MTTHEQDERERTERHDEIIGALNSIARALYKIHHTFGDEFERRGRDTFTMTPVALDDCYVCGIHKAITRITPGDCVVTISGQEIGGTEVSLCADCASVTKVVVRPRERQP